MPGGGGRAPWAAAVVRGRPPWEVLWWPGTLRSRFGVCVVWWLLICEMIRVDRGLAEAPVTEAPQVFLCLTFCAAASPLPAPTLGDASVFILTPHTHINMNTLTSPAHARAYVCAQSDAVRGCLTPVVHRPRRHTFAHTDAVRGCLTQWCTDLAGTCPSICACTRRCCRAFFLWHCALCCFALFL